MIVITMSCQSQYVRMFDGVPLKCMLTWHTDYLENKSLALHLENVADACPSPWLRNLLVGSVAQLKRLKSLARVLFRETLAMEQDVTLKHVWL